MSLGENIRKIRKSKGFSIMKVKELTSLSKSTISDLENDKSSPTADTLQKIAEALGVTVDEFFKEDGSNTDIEVEKKIKEIESMPDFENAEEALKFILAQPTMMDFGGYDLKNMSEEQIVEIANDMLFAMRLSIDKMKRKNK